MFYHYFDQIERYLYESIRFVYNLNFLRCPCARCSRGEVVEMYASLMLVSVFSENAFCPLENSFLSIIHRPHESISKTHSKRQHNRKAHPLQQTAGIDLDFTAKSNISS